MRDDAVWLREEEFWKGDARLYDERLAPEALLVFAPPVGVLDRRSAIEAIWQAPRWKNLQFQERRLIRPSSSLIVLTYLAHADRGDAASAYRAQCSSSYVLLGTEWQLALHHQTPLPAA
jgi:Domain of unknown function (DUF4440)